ncbi:MAG: pirin family protein [Candidatus Pacebacteria bacterium]|nr:pirin family protein [Candidatus Paceibacterota bacterium]MCD8508397.1 pirin family protein [Candidatus Paceibacterota bacterium]MCD8528236.1 pirin family protein [Candidatus Paceibacterota bacterium]MCD8563712.1 pirin family protein [Candidatus Paceibacterota bacterium]
MIQKIHAAERHQGDHGWLKTHWLFSFGNYYDPTNMGFGVLRVFNDDIVMPHSGFPDHPHDTMEIVTIILSGVLTHTDSIGNEATITAGQIQRMSAGAGIVHSEFNKHDEPVHLYQLWFHPNTTTQADYEEMDITPSTEGPLTLLASPEGGEGLTLRADARIWQYTLDGSAIWNMSPDAGWGHLVYVTEGSLTINGETFQEGDQARITDETTLVYAGTQGKGVIIEVRTTTP